MSKSQITALNVSNYFTNKAIHNSNPLTIMQALKLTYIAQGFHLALEERPFFQENAYAWKYGPVIQEVYNHLKRVSTDNIIQFVEDVSSFNKKQKEILRVVFNKYIKFDAWSLSQLTHRPGTPWHQSFELPLTKVRRLDLLRPQIVLHRQLPKTSVFGLTSSPRASHPVVPTVGRFLFRQIQYIMIFFKRQYFFFSPKGVSRFAQAANRPLPEERGLTATLDKKEENSLISQDIIKKYFKEEIVTPESFILLLSQT